MTRLGPNAAAAATFACLVLLSGSYGWHRDELYFRMLPAAWGYVDQPPLVPFLARTLGDSLLLTRLPAAGAAALSVIVVAAIAGLLGADRRRQTWCAWSYAGTTAVLGFGHILLTSALDVLLWPLICLLVMAAELRNRPGLWLAAGAVAGVASYNRLLVVVLLAGIAIGLVTTGRLRRLLTWPPWVAAVVAAVVALPNIAYQAGHGWPQLAMGAALAEGNSGEVRGFMWVFLAVVLGPVLVPVWLRGLVALWSREDWRPVRFIVPAFALLLGFTLVSGAQPHYPTFLVMVPLAAGFAASTGSRPSATAVVAVAVNAAVSAVVSLPLLPVDVLARTPIPEMNQLAADQIGWPAYVEQIRTVQAETGTDAVVLTSNYGEAGAVALYAPELEIYSGHNALGMLPPPGEGTDTVVVVGGQLEQVRDLFSGCEVVDRLDNGAGVDNEEQGMPAAVCSDPIAPWRELWPRLRHLD